MDVEMILPQRSKGSFGGRSMANGQDGGAKATAATE
jgi:hypothetical protein